VVKPPLNIIVVDDSGDTPFVRFCQAVDELESATRAFVTSIGSVDTEEEREKIRERVRLARVNIKRLFNNQLTRTDETVEAGTSVAALVKAAREVVAEFDHDALGAGTSARVLRLESLLKKFVVPDHTIAGTKLTEAQYQVIQRMRVAGLAPIPTGAYEQERINPKTFLRRNVGRLESVVYDYIINRAGGLGLWHEARDLYQALWPENYYDLID
jgi:hypothetical protein